MAGVVDRVGLCLFGSNVWVVQARAHFTGELVGACDADGADGIQLVRIEQDLCFDGFGRAIIPVTMGAHTVYDVLFAIGRQCQRRYYFFSQLSPFFGVA